MVYVQIENAGVLKIFGPDSQPWREAKEPWLQPAIALASTNASDALSLAQELVSKAGIAGIVRFRCEVPAQVIA